MATAAFTSLSIQPQSRGTLYGTQAVEAYAKFAHGSDMALFLDPYIQQDLDRQKGKKILDAGCGAAPWSIYAAEHGANYVNAIDLQPDMINKAREAIGKAGISRQVHAEVGDATNLAFKENSFDHAISVNVGCNLPAEIFKLHFEEIARTLKPNATGTIAVPDSLDTVFTDGSKPDSEIHGEIESALASLPDNPDALTIQSSLNQLKEVVSATFTMKDNRLILVEDQKDLAKGQKIWRKLAKVTLPNHYHSEAEYLDAFKQSKLKVQRVSRKTFDSEAVRLKFNTSPNIHPKLGEAYETRSPFVVYHLQKETSLKKKNSLCTMCVLL